MSDETSIDERHEKIIGDADYDAGSIKGPARAGGRA